MKRTLKQILTLTVLVLVVIAFTSCWRGDLSSETVITSREGAGTRTFVVNVWKNGSTLPDNTILTDNEWDPDAETGYLKGTNAEIEAKLESAAPFAGMDISTSETDTKRFFYITFSFTSIGDYNDKLEAMFDAASAVYGSNGELDLRGTFIPATLTVDGDQVTFTDSWQSSIIGTDWAWAAIYNDPALINQDGLGKNMFLYCEPLDVTVGDTEDTFGPNGESGIAFADLSDNHVNGTYSLTGTIAEAVATPTDAATPTEGENPVTGDPAVLGALAAALLAAGTFVTLRTRKS